MSDTTLGGVVAALPYRVGVGSPPRIPPTATSSPIQMCASMCPMSCAEMTTVCRYFHRPVARSNPDEDWLDGSLVSSSIYSQGRGPQGSQYQQRPREIRVDRLIEPSEVSPLNPNTSGDDIGLCLACSRNGEQLVNDQVLRVRPEATWILAPDEALVITWPIVLHGVAAAPQVLLSIPVRPLTWSVIAAGAACAATETLLSGLAPTSRTMSHGYASLRSSKHSPVECSQAP